MKLARWILQAGLCCLLVSFSRAQDDPADQFDCITEIRAKAEALQATCYMEPGPGETAEQNNGWKKIVVRQFPKQANTALARIDFRSYPNTALVKVFPSTFKRSFSKLKTKGWDSTYAKAVLRCTLIHEIMHACLGEATGDTDPESCIHLAIDASVAKKACERIAEIINTGSGTPDEAEELEALCDKIAKLRSKWNDEEGANKACGCITGMPVEDLVARNNDMNGPDGSNDPSDDIDPDSQCKVAYPEDSVPGEGCAFDNNEVIPECPGCP